ncbi:hypothetical protein SAMN05192583_3350 [Sphingomonas gellani]|uniref:Uncharacterized protein n=1 Tax=Sphingomonas gellani TaxID=1166340 RepID=A0A1H8ILV3_9SPHN|nr:hypothetical protein [Sphingomonas gellani]SEN69910.1 hypothetical protein SAMN05192583_3350 [Sphingomonas gellani]
MSEFDPATTEAAVATYQSAIGVFTPLLHEVRELSKKKPDATLSASKVKLVNNVLDDLLAIVKSEPEGKYLERLEDDDLPQVSDALMMMAQFNAALDAFNKRYHRYVKVRFERQHRWITVEQVAEWEAENQSTDGEEVD